MKGTCNGFADRILVDDFDNQLCGIGKRLGVIHFLAGHAAQFRPVGLSHQKDDRFRIVIGDMQGDGRIHGAGPAADDANTRPVAQPGMRHCHVSCAAFMPTDNQFDIGEIDQGIGQGQIAFAGNAIGGVYTMGIERCGQDMGG